MRILLSTDIYIKERKNFTANDFNQRSQKNSINSDGKMAVDSVPCVANKILNELKRIELQNIFSSMVFSAYHCNLFNLLN